MTEKTYEDGVKDGYYQCGVDTSAEFRKQVEAAKEAIYKELEGRIKAAMECETRVREQVEKMYKEIYRNQTAELAALKRRNENLNKNVEMMTKKLESLKALNEHLIETNKQLQRN